MDVLFRIALFLIPFDNLFFAPSTGWATVAPLFFFGYALLNYRLIIKYLKSEKYIIQLFLFAAFYTALLWCMNGLTVQAAVDSLQTMVLGVSFYFALVIRYGSGNKIDKDAKVLITAYGCSCIYGVIWLISKSFFPGFFVLFHALEKRHYARMCFSFTEPSFISIHIIGVLLLFSYFVHDINLRKRIYKLSFLMLAFAMIFGGSARLLIDLVVLIVLLGIKYLIKNKKYIIRNALIVLLSMGAVFMLFNQSARMQTILENGVYADPSLAARFFRLNAYMKGAKDDISSAILGSGVGNVYVVFQEGYDEAYEEFSNGYKEEVLSLKDTWDIQVYNLPIKVMAEFGGVFAIVLAACLLLNLKKKKVDICVILSILWLYFQFDSYAFYSLWILVFLGKFYDKERFGESYFEDFAQSIEMLGKRRIRKKKNKYIVCAANCKGLRYE